MFAWAFVRMSANASTCAHTCMYAYHERAYVHPRTAIDENQARGHAADACAWPTAVSPYMQACADLSPAPAPEQPSYGVIRTQKQRPA